MVQALVAYDVHIGQRNWNELTPFGESRMNNHVEVGVWLVFGCIRWTLKRSIRLFQGHPLKITLPVA